VVAVTVAGTVSVSSGSIMATFGARDQSAIAFFSFVLTFLITATLVTSAPVPALYYLVCVFFQIGNPKYLLLD